MSGTHDGPAVDPLTALRAADHRPTLEIWQDKIRHGLVAGLKGAARSSAAALIALAVSAAIVWRLFVTTQPPVEDSIPLARATSEAPAVSVEDPNPPNQATETAGFADEPQSESLVVHVAGAVLEPGLVFGSVGWRIDDAVRAAGGPRSTADLDRLNLAAPLADGERIYVPEFGEDEPSVVGPTRGANSDGGGASGPIDLNRAEAVALQALPGIGPATAAAIIAHREEHGSFGSVDALVAVRGIGPATLEALRDHVRV
ncbi:MAG: competence protein ComEA [Verrucomicrobiales bacterium]|jgi:competence protein ComEA